MFLSNSSYSSAICVKANLWMYIKERWEHINNIQSQSDQDAEVERHLTQLDQDVEVERHLTQPHRDAELFCRNR